MERLSTQTTISMVGGTSKKAKKKKKGKRGGGEQAPGPVGGALVDAEPADKDNVVSSPVLPLGSGAGEPPTSGISGQMPQKMTTLSQGTALLNTYFFKAKLTSCLEVLDRRSKWLSMGLGQLGKGPDYLVSHALLQKADD